MDGAGNKLGGTGADNGDFTGEVFTIDKTAPTVQSINRVGGTPTNAGSVDWTVTFSENVSGVNAADFDLIVSGLAGSPSITGVTGSGSSYTVTASTGTGTGTLGLNLDDDDTIVDGAGNRLGGTGADNGDFTGQVYSVDRAAPTATITRTNSNPTNAGSVSWTVDVSESVTGLTQSDFQLSQGGSVSGASITGFSGSGDTYTVTASTGSGSGTLSVTLVDDNSVVDGAGNPLNGPGTTNVVSEAYTIDKTAPQLQTLTMLDENNDGRIDKVNAIFDEALTGSGTTNAGWSASATPGGVSVGATVTITGSTAGVAFTGGTAGTNSTAVGSFTLSLNGTTGQIRDALGNKASFTNEAPADAASPVPFSLIDTDGTNNGRFEQNDTATITFTEDVTNSATTPMSVQLIDPAGNNPTDNWSAPGFIQGTLTLGNANPVDYLSGNNNTTTFSSSALDQPNPNQIRVKLGSCGACSNVTTATAATNVAVTPSTTIEDAANNDAKPNSASPTFSIRLF